jgi:hypothetical protein
MQSAEWICASALLIVRTTHAAPLPTAPHVTNAALPLSLPTPVPP